MASATTNSKSGIVGLDGVQLLRQGLGHEVAGNEKERQDDNPGRALTRRHSATASAKVGSE